MNDNCLVVSVSELSKKYDFDVRIEAKMIWDDRIDMYRPNVYIIDDRAIFYTANNPEGMINPKFGMPIDAMTFPSGKYDSVMLTQ